MLQRSYRDSQYETLYQQNTILRDRVRKMGEIQPYVEILLQNNKQYQHEINQLQVQNHRLRCKIDQMTEQTIRIKQSHSSQTTILKNNFQADIDKLLRELKQILRDKDAMKNQNELIIQELQTKYRRDIETKRLQHQELERQFHNRLNKMAELLRENQRILEQKIWQFSNKETELIRDIEKLGIQRNSLLKDKALLEQEVGVKNNQKEALFKKNKQLQRQNEQTSKKWLQSEQDKSQTILQLKDMNKNLIHENQSLVNQLRAHEKTINEHNRRIVNLTRQCEDVCMKNSDLEANFRRLLRNKNDLEAQHKDTLQKLDLINKSSSQDISYQQNQIQTLIEQNKKLYKQNTALDSQCRDKNAQISDLLRAVEKLELKLAQTTEKCVKIQNENSKLISHVKKLEQNLEEFMLENKNLSEKIGLYTKHNETLEKMLEKQKRKNISLETSRFEIQNIALGALNKPDQICKQYERQIQKIVHQFVQQRKIQDEKNLGQINKIKAAYQSVLREKQEYFDRKILYLEKQVNQLRRIN